MRVGVAGVGSTSAVTGLRPVVQNLVDEGLVRIGDNGRPEPRLAQSWSVATDGLSLKVHLRPSTKFHDGSPVSADLVARILNDSLPAFMGPAFRDVDRIVASGPDVVEISLKQASPFVQEALEIPIRKPDDPAIATGPFSQVNPTAVGELRANPNYYLGRPAIDRITFTTYPTVRAAWADMLRDKVDMLYEVSVEAREFMQAATNVSVFSFTRPYQYVVVLNLHSPKMRSASLRRALNLAIDRPALVRDVFDGHALPSSGPVWPNHWSFTDDFSKITFDPQTAAKLLSANVSRLASGSATPFEFTCLVPADYERLALVVKRQLEAVGVVMNLKLSSTDEAVQALGTRTFEAVLLDLISGPNLFRTYEVWYSTGSRNIGALGSTAMDAPLDRIRYATSDEAYSQAVAAFQQFAVDNPPAIFLAWSERARAINRRFVVPAEPGRDALISLHRWRPADAETLATRN